MKIALQPFQTPNFVIAQIAPGLKQDGYREAPSFPLSTLDASELSDMCDAFRATCFNKAGLTDPRTPPQVPQDKKVIG